MGGEKFVKAVRKLLGAKGHKRETLQRRNFRWSPPFEKIWEVVCGEYGADPAEVRKKRKRGSLAKQMAVYVARERCGLPVADIALQAGKVTPSAVTNAVTRVRATAEKDAELARRLAKIQDPLTASQETSSPEAKAPLSV